MSIKKAFIGIAVAASAIWATPQAKAEPIVAYIATDLIASVLLDQSGARFFPFSAFYDRENGGHRYGRHGRHHRRHRH